MNSDRRVQNLIAYCQFRHVMQDDGPLPLVQAQFGDIQTIDDLPIIGHFGFSSSPPVNANAIAVFQAGDKSKGIIIGTVDPTSRRKLLLAGETVVHDLWGNEVHFAQGQITVKHAALVVVDAPLTIFKGAVEFQQPVTGDLNVRGEVTAGFGTGDQVGLQTHTTPSAPPGGLSAPTPGS